MTFYSQSPIKFGSVSMVTASLGANDPEVGTVVREGDEEYIFVYNNGTTQISKGNAAVCSAVTGYSVTVSSTTQVDHPIGVCKHATLTTGTYGWLLRKGFGPCAAAANTALTAGDLLAIAADGTWAPKAASTHYSQSVAPTAFGKVMVATASAGVGDAYYSIG